jgi:DivIVA domain-containing protein
MAMSPAHSHAARGVGPTPDEVRSATFTQSQLAWRGYSEDEVHAFLAQVADAMATADSERIGLRVEVERLRNYYREHGVDVDRLTPGTRRGSQGLEVDSLVPRLEQYTEVQFDQARKYATAVDNRNEERAGEVFHHAKVQAALATEQSIRMFLDSAGRRSPTTGAELERASVWLRAFVAALYAQLEVINDALTVEMQRLGAAPTRRR